MTLLSAIETAMESIHEGMSVIIRYNRNAESEELRDILAELNKILDRLDAFPNGKPQTDLTNDEE